ncbi:MAG: hypothetical protein R3C49_15875 [Planctomycetaceae bacterium]
MARIEVEMELTGFRLKVKAEREDDVARITQQLGRQLAGMTQPLAGIVDSPRAIETQTVQESGEAALLQKSAAKSTRKRNRKTGENGGSQPITWQHDAAAWGTPKQAWTAAQKILWIMYVIGKATGQSEIGGPTIAESFNKSFKQFGTLKKNNMPRDLGALKTKSPAQVLDNTAASPITWYLTEAGTLEAEKLVAEARGDSTVSSIAE